MVGSNLLNQLLDHPEYTKVTALVRNEIPFSHPKLRQLVLNFDNLEDYSNEIRGDVVFCALGTTSDITPDQQEYKKIDYQYPLDIAFIAHQNGVPQYHLISSLGANEKSPIFYARLKGEVERDLKTIPFKSIYIYRPSLLEGKRKERRSAEKAMIVLLRILNPFLFGRRKKYKSIKGEEVAKAMLYQSLKPFEGVFILNSDDMKHLG